MTEFIIHPLGSDLCQTLGVNDIRGNFHPLTFKSYDQAFMSAEALKLEEYAITVKNDGCLLVEGLK